MRKDPKTALSRWLVIATRAWRGQSPVFGRFRRRADGNFLLLGGKRDAEIYQISNRNVNDFCPDSRFGYSGDHTVARS